MPVVTFRRALPEDARLMSETRQKAWAATYRGIYDDAMIDGYDLECFEARDRRRIEDPRQNCFLVMDGGACVGYFHYGPCTYGPYQDFALCLNSLYFLPPYQRMGLGKRVFDQLRAHCRAQGLSKFFCGCNLHNVPAMAFYRKMGGVVGRICDGHENKAEDQCYFEFYLSEEEQP